MFRFFLILFSFFIFTSCGIYKKEIIYINPTDDTTPVKPIEIKIENIPEQIVYYTRLSTIHPNVDNRLFLAKGLGGLGAMLDEYSNQLLPFEGINIKVSEWVPSEKIKVEIKINGNSNDETICQNLFHYNSKKSRIEIKNPEQIETLIECSIHVKISALNKNDKVTEYENTFPIVFNLTFKDYANKNDPLVFALLKQSKLTDIDQLIAWLSRYENSSKLIINHQDYADKISHANALTGLTHINVLDVSSTALESTRALSYLLQLNELNLSNTRINSHELSHVSYLSKKSALKKLFLSNLKLYDISFLDNNFKNLTDLNLANNPTLFNHLSNDDLNKFSKLKSLEILDLSNTGLNNFAQFDGLNNIENSLVTLNISKNNLSVLDNADNLFLKNLLNLNSLNVSESNMSVAFLNKYFAFLDISSHPKLKTFIYRGDYAKNKTPTKFCDTLKDSFALQISEIKLPSMLQTIDFHGQGCINAEKIELGLINTDIFNPVKDLVNLDISSTPVKDFSGLKILQNLKNMTITDSDGGISMTKTGCYDAVRNIIPHVNVFSCELLPEPNKSYAIFNHKPVTQIFTVPENVWFITITGCSGANGGAGGGASGALGFIKANYSYYGANGGDSGNTNGNPLSMTRGHPTPHQGEYLVKNTTLWHKHPAHQNQTGHNGGLGTESKITTNNQNVISFSKATPNIPNEIQKCFGGQNGVGAPSLQSNTKIGRGGSPDPNKFMSGAGATNAYLPWSSPIETLQRLPVTPGQIFHIDVGYGGFGNSGGTPEFIKLENGTILNGAPPQDEENKGYRGYFGNNGTRGSDGFVKIEWDSGV